MRMPKSFRLGTATSEPSKTRSSASTLCARGQQFPLVLWESYVRSSFRTDPEQGLTTQNAYAQASFHSVIANPHDGLTSADRLLVREFVYLAFSYQPPQ